MVFLDEAGLPKEKVESLKAIHYWIDDGDLTGKRRRNTFKHAIDIVVVLGRSCQNMYSKIRRGEVLFKGADILPQQCCIS